jgi:hypothetical protein
MQARKKPTMTLSSIPKCDCSEWLAGIKDGLTYSPFFRLTLNASVLMPEFEHSLRHAGVPGRRRISRQARAQSRPEL